VSWSKIAVGCYLGLYAVVGLALGFWITKLPGQLEKKAAEYTGIALSTESATASVSKNSTRKWLFPLAVLAFIVLTFLLASGKTFGGQRALYAVARTAAALLAWFLFVQPLVTYFFKKWTKRKSEAEKGVLLQIMEFFPELRSKARGLYRHISGKHKGWRRLTEFVVALFVVAIYGE
jgi:hypothetical protein